MMLLKRITRSLGMYEMNYEPKQAFAFSSRRYVRLSTATAVSEHAAHAMIRNVRIDMVVK